MTARLAHHLLTDWIDLMLLAADLLEAAGLMVAALLATSNVHTRDGDRGSIQIVCQDALVSHCCMSSCVDQCVWLHHTAKLNHSVLLTLRPPADSTVRPCAAL